jgi:hypothetical protein
VLLLATIGRKWKLRSVDDAVPEIEPRITLRPRGGLRMRAESR